MHSLQQLASVIQDKVDLIEALEGIIPFAPNTQDIIDKELDELAGLVRDILESNT